MNYNATNLALKSYKSINSRKLKQFFSSLKEKDFIGKKYFALLANFNFS